jgi:hypothetical protein
METSYGEAAQEGAHFKAPLIGIMKLHQIGFGVEASER